MKDKLKFLMTKDNFTAFIVSILEYTLIEFLAQNIFIAPNSLITRLSGFLPPILGLMWGLPAAFGVMVADIIILSLEPFPVPAETIFRDMLSLFLITYLPHFLWFRILLPKNNEPFFSLNLHTLMKFVIIMFICNVASSALFGITAPKSELDKFTIFAGRSYDMPRYIFLRLLHNLDLTLFASTATFLILIGVGFPFEPPHKHLKNKLMPSTSMIRSSNYRELVALISSLSLFFMVIYLIMSYSGMIKNLNLIRTWETFITSILTLLDLVFIGFLALLLKFKNSIMLEMVMLSVAIVFSASTILGIIGIVTVENILDRDSREDLRQIGMIQTEHLSRVFDNIEVSVKNMQDFALDELGDYNSLINNTEYRKNYVDELEAKCEILAQNTTGIADFYMRFNHELIGEEDGFYWILNGTDRIRDKNIFEKKPVTPIADYEEGNVEYVGWYYIPIEAGKPTWTLPYFNLNTKVYMISYVIPMYHHGEFFGLVGMDIDVKYIIREIQKMSIYNHGFAYLVDSQNRAIYHKNYSIGSFVETDPDLRIVEMDVRNGMTLAVANALEDIEQDRNELVIRLLLATLIVAVVLSLVSIRVASGIVRPLIQVNEAAKKIAAGHLEIALNYESQNELGSMVQSIHEMVKKLDGYMYRDQMTGVKNNAAYILAMKEIDERIAAGENFKFGVIVFDVNSLKYVNDNYGHDAGNELIRRATEMICSAFRYSQVYRTGGDEFIAIIENEDYKDRKHLLEKFDQSVHSEMIRLGEEDFHVSVAYGLGIFDKKIDKDYKTVFKRADSEMYVNKEKIKKELNLPSR